MTAPRVVVGYGLGVDSTAILLRWIYEPETRPCPLGELLVVTAMTGDEWPRTGQLVTEHMLPLFRRNGIRYVQLARRGPLKEHGINVLDDSRGYGPLHLQGDYKLSDEMIANGTVPQTGGIRKCSMKSKGEVIDRWLEGELGGAPFTHVIGFEANELSRAVRDASYNTAQRTGSYPLIEWGWDRAQCERYITEKTGADWIKSACTFCVFALANKAGVTRVQAMFEAEHQAGVRALMMELASIALNPLQGLMKSEVKNGVITKRGRLANLLAGQQHLPVMQAFLAEMAKVPWAIYEVQRVAMPTAADPAKGVWNRSVTKLFSGTRREMRDLLPLLAEDHGAEVEIDEDGIHRVYLARRGAGFPAYERMFVVAPDGVQDKAPKAFYTARSAFQAA
jgi:hypothetical protein